MLRLGAILGTTYSSFTYFDSYYLLKIICPHCNNLYDTTRVPAASYKELHTCAEVYCRYCFRTFILSIKQLPGTCAECEKRVTCLLDGYTEPIAKFFKPHYEDTSPTCTPGSVWISGANSTSDSSSWTVCSSSSGTTYE